LNVKHRPNRTRQPVTERVANAFLARVDRRGGECWTWTGKRDSDGYGVLYIDGGDFRAPRVAYELANDRAPGDLMVCHRCDNPACVNPSHLFLGTGQDNTRDRNAKRRQARGERSGVAKLTDAAVREIRAALSMGETQVSVAGRFGVTQATVSLVKLGRVWGHVA
jgi:hypothetical protein